MKNPKIADSAAPIVAPTAPAVNPFAELLRAYESAYTSGGDYSAALTALATACARSVLRRCIDPQRTAATTRDGVSNGGCNPAMVAMQRDLTADAATLAALDSAGLAARSLLYNDHGDLESVVVAPDADAALDHAAAVTLSDGIDLMQTAVESLLEQSAEHADGTPGWMERTYTTRRLSKRVLIQSTDSAAWVDAETTPVQEVYRAAIGVKDAGNKAGSFQTREEKTILRFVFRAIYTRYNGLAYAWQNDSRAVSQTPLSAGANKAMAENPKSEEFSPEKPTEEAPVTVCTADSVEEEKK